MNNDFSLSNTSFMQGYSPLKMMEGMPCLYENIPKQKVQINRPKRIRKRKQKELIKKGRNYILKEKVIYEILPLILKLGDITFQEFSKIFIFVTFTGLI